MSEYGPSFSHSRDPMWHLSGTPTPPRRVSKEPWKYDPEDPDYEEFNRRFDEGGNCREIHDRRMAEEDPAR